MVSQKCARGFGAAVSVEVAELTKSERMLVGVVIVHLWIRSRVLKRAMTLV